MGVVLFDVDGVLRDSYHTHLRVWRAWCAQRGLDQDRIGLATFGRRPRDVIADLAPALGIGSSHPESMLDADMFTPALTDAAEIITSWASHPS